MFRFVCRSQHRYGTTIFTGVGLTWFDSHLCVHGLHTAIDTRSDFVHEPKGLTDTFKSSSATTIPLDPKAYHPAHKRSKVDLHRQLSGNGGL